MVAVCALLKVSFVCWCEFRQALLVLLIEDVLCKEINPNSLMSGSWRHTVGRTTEVIGWMSGGVSYKTSHADSEWILLNVSYPVPPRAWLAHPRSQPPPNCSSLGVAYGEADRTAYLRKAEWVTGCNCLMVGIVN